MDENEPRIFLCHASDDKAQVRELYHQLKAAGYHPWLDEEDLLPGQTWWAEIKKVLSDPHNLVVVCLSGNSVTKRGVVQKEIKWALDVLDETPEGTIYLIPARLEDCEVPDRLSDLHWVNLFEPGGFEKLKGALDFEISRRPAPYEPEDKHAKHAWNRLPLLAVAGLLALVTGVVAVGVEASGLVGGTGGSAAAAPTTSVPLTAKGPSPTRTPLPATATSTSAPAVINTPHSTPTPSPTATDTATAGPTSSPTVASLPTATATSVLTATLTPTPNLQSPNPTRALGIGGTMVRDKDGMVMVYVPDGKFEMGSTEGDADEQPVHIVTLEDFWFDKTEVTNAEYARCVADGICGRPDRSSSRTRESYYGNRQFDDYPVISVSWHRADTYCKWAEGRLPTEAEWEYAARGPDAHIYPWGNDAPDDTVANYYQNVGDTTEVGSYPDGASWVGALNMAGNIREWVEDWYDGYPGTTYQSDRFGTTAKVLRGGSWLIGEEYVRAANRGYGDPRSYTDTVGFRCVVEPGD